MDRRGSRAIAWQALILEIRGPTPWAALQSCGDWAIDLAPEGFEKGSEIVLAGMPEEVAEHPTSHTGRYLNQVLEQHLAEAVVVCRWPWRGRGRAGGGVSGGLIAGRGRQSPKWPP